MCLGLLIYFIAVAYKYFCFSYKSGQLIVLILRDDKQETLNVLKGHSDEVHSLVWSPVPASELPDGK